MAASSISQIGYVALHTVRVYSAGFHPLCWAMKKLPSTNVETNAVLKMSATTQRAGLLCAEKLMTPRQMTEMAKTVVGQSYCRTFIIIGWLQGSRESLSIVHPQGYFVKYPCAISGKRLEYG